MAAMNSCALFRALVLLSPTLVSASCDASQCVVASFQFYEGRTECGSCVPAGSKYRCPASNGGNAYQVAIDATFQGGFGNWELDSHCVHDAYNPGFLAFSGPGAWEDDFVPNCPDVTFCACGDVKDKIIALMHNPDSLSGHEKNPMYWASAADQFTLYSGFTSVSGGSVPHYDLLYKYEDGRRQFCANWPSFAYSAPGSASADLPIVNAAPAQASMAADTSPVWSDWSEWSACSQACGTSGTSTRSRYVMGGSGALLNTQPIGDYRETQSCNRQACHTYETSCSLWPSWCESGYSQTSTPWCSTTWWDYTWKRVCEQQP